MNPDRREARRLMSARRGTFPPFSEGPTACLGSRMAMVELVASLAYIFRKFRVRAPLESTSRSDEIGVEASEAESRARLIRQITKDVAFNLVVQTAKPLSVELIPRR